MTVMALEGVENGTETIGFESILHVSKDFHLHIAPAASLLCTQAKIHLIFYSSKES